MADLIMKGGTIVTMDKERRAIKDGAVSVNRDRIEFAGTLWVA